VAGIKTQFGDEEIAIYDGGVIYKRGEYWHFRMWLRAENKYARKSLRTTNQTTAIERGKAAYIELQANMQSGKKYFSITTKEGVEKYVAHRQKDVDTGQIVSGRLATIKTHLQHWLAFIGKDTKLKELDRADCENYYYERHKKSGGRVALLTVEQEQSTINALMKWLHRNNETQVGAFEFRKLQKQDDNNEAIRRATFTNDEYNRLIRASRVYADKDTHKLDDDEWKTRQLMRYFILIAANSGLRVGELRQLRWNDVKVERKRANGEERVLARIDVRAETSKVRKSRVLYCRGGNNFEQLKKVLKPEAVNALVFSVGGEEAISKRALLYHFHKLVELAKIDDAKQRGIVPYSLRHFMITQRVMSGLNFTQVADMCGTSVTQIERTYWHLNDDVRLTSALADYKRKSDGTIEVI
jgi:integrase